MNSIYENPYKILVNGEEKQIQGYNIDDYSYFKLRDIAEAVGGFEVGFENDTIQLSKDGYVYNNPAIDYSKYLGSYSKLGGSLGFYWHLDVTEISEDGIVFEFSYDKEGSEYVSEKAVFTDATHAVANGKFIFKSADGSYSEEDMIFNITLEDNGIVCNDILFSFGTKTNNSQSSSSLTITDDIKNNLSDLCIRISDFNDSSTVKTKEFANNFIFYYYTGKSSSVSKYDKSLNYDFDELFYGWSEDEVIRQYRLLFGQDMPIMTNDYEDRLYKYESGYYWVHASNYGDVKYEYINSVNTDDGIDVIFNHMDSEGYSFGTVTCHIVTADNENGYILTSKKSSNY